jgi:hypothetical protein
MSRQLCTAADAFQEPAPSLSAAFTDDKRQAKKCPANRAFFFKRKDYRL